MTVQFGLCTCAKGVNQGWLRLQITSSGDPYSLQDNESPTTAEATASNPACDKTHIYEWSVENGVASKTFDLPDSETNRRIRVTLGLADADPSNASLPRGSYVIDLKVFTGFDASSLLTAPIRLVSTLVLYISQSALSHTF